MVFSQHTKLAKNELAIKIITLAVVLAALLFSSLAHAEYALNFQEPVTQVARDIYGLHMLIFWICVVIFVVVFSFMFYSIFAHRKSKNYEAAKFSHSTKVEIVWTVIPSIILVLMAWPATQVLINMEDTTLSEHTIKITGYQWKWGYEYLDTDISFYSTLATPREQINQFDKATAVEQGENYLLEVDKHLVVPSGRKIRALITANDVIHAWWVPAFGTKKDAIPGYINELWFNVDEGKEGFYRGQCAELCGKDHAFMPIVVEVVTGEQFDSWLASGGTSFDSKSIADQSDPQTESAAVEAVVDTIAPAAIASETAIASDAVSAKTWTKDELMSMGEQVYNSRCAACHGVEGKGIPGAFPAIAGSEVVKGDRQAQTDLIMFGKAGTAMAAFAGQINDEEIASVITYQRNAFGNEVGDVVLPADIKANRKN